MKQRRMRFYVRIFAGLLVTLGIGLGAYTAFQSSEKVDMQKIFSDRTLLSGLWNSYKQEYWEKETGRTLDTQQDNITTSEGQSYTLLRAVWQSDKPTFDKTWQWTQEQIQREDNLFAWKWGQRSDGTYGLLESQGGQNTASDGDTDIALALVMAATRWQQQSYLDDAKEIIASIWEIEVIDVQGVSYVASNNLEKNSSQDAVINPSYFAPYAYRIFAIIDPEHDWMEVVDSSYDLIERTMDAKLDVASSAQLVPNWVFMNKETGGLRAPDASSTLTTDYGYDAMRTAWRLALDYVWYGDSRATTTLSKMNFLAKTWQDTGRLHAIYDHAGNIVSDDQPPEAYGTAIGYFMLTNPALAEEVYETKLQTLYDASENTWSQPMNYYSDNWTWFGIALYINQLPNLTVAP